MLPEMQFVYKPLKPEQNIFTTIYIRVGVAYDHHICSQPDFNKSAQIQIFQTCACVGATENCDRTTTAIQNTEKHRTLSSAPSLPARCAATKAIYRRAERRPACSPLYRGKVQLPHSNQRRNAKALQLTVQ